MTRHARPPAARRRLSILILLSLLVSSAGTVVAAPISPASAATTQVVFTADATCIIADGVSSITVELWGGGGGGGNKGPGNNAGSGGGGGAYARAEFVVTPGQAFTIKVGAGGDPATDGGLSRFSLTESMATVNIVANGGKAGGQRSNTNSNVGPGGAVSTEAPGSENGTLVSRAGGTGGEGSTGGSRSGGGGGGSATSDSAGGSGGDASSVGGTGGTGQGSGGNGSSSGDGSSGNAPGGGGGGGGGSNAASGGAGARGEVRISSVGSGPVPCVGESGSGGDDTVPGSGDPVDPAQPTLASCGPDPEDTEPPQPHNGLIVTPGHGPILYVDTGQSQRLDSAYLAYRVTSTTARSDLWVEVSGLDENVRLVNASQSAVPLGEVGVGDAGARSAFFLVRSDGGFVGDQTHIVRVYRSDPRAGSPEPLYHCEFTIERVDETIKAGANKVDVIATTTAVRLGDTYTITVEGDSGTIGAGNSDDGRMIWVSPASRSDWPVGALRLERTEVTLFSDAGLTRVLSTHVDTLRINEETGLTTKNRQYYRAVYTFRVIGTASAPVPIVPAAMISSGRQIKHTDASDLPEFAVDVTEPTVELEVDKTASTDLAVDTDAETAEITYSITVTNKGDSALTVDAIVDTPDSGLEFVPGSAKLDDSAILNPAEAGGDLSFSGPISVAAGATRTLSYRMSFSFDACIGDPPSFTNTAFARVGDVIVGASETAKPKVSVTVTCGSDGTPSPTLAVVDDADETVPPQVQTLPATDIATTDPATDPSTTESRLNALVDPNGTAGLKVRFRYSTDAGLAEPQDVLLTDTTDATAAYGVSALLSGLDHATPYYFRIEVYDADSGEATVFGETLSFTTPPEPESPLAVTGAATDRTSTTAVLTGTIDPRRNTSRVQFEWVKGAKGAEGAEGAACLPDHTTLSTSGPLEDEGEVIELDGAAPVTMTFEAAGLEALEDYCFRIVALHGADFESRDEGDWEPFTTLGVQVVTLSTVPPEEDTDPVDTLEVGAVQALFATSDYPDAEFTFTSEDPEFCSIVFDGGTPSVKGIAGGTCTIRVDEPGTDGIEPAFATLTFTVQGASQLRFMQQPPEPPDDAVAGEPIAPAITVQIEDADGEPVTSSTAAVTLVIQANPAAGTLAGEVTVKADGGIATFNDLSIDKAGTGYTLRATSAGLASAVSEPFNVVAGAASALALTTAAAGAASGAAFTTQPVVAIRDAQGNLTASTAEVTMTVSSGGTVVGTATVEAVDGVATFTNVGISGTSGTYTLTFASTGLTNETQTIALGAGSSDAGESDIVASPATDVTADNIATSTLTITVRDASRNPVGGESVFFAITGGMGGTLSTGPWTTGAGGEATATVRSTTSGTITVTGYLGTGTEGDPVGDVTVAFVAGAAAEVSVTLDPTSVVSSGGTSTATALVTDIFGNPVSGADVTFSSTSADRATVGAGGSTDGDGRVTATVTAGTEAGTVDITASIAGITGSAPLTVNPGPASATTSTVTADPVSLEADGTATSTLTVQLKDANDNALTTGGATVTFGALGTDQGSIGTVTDNGDGTYTAIYTAGTLAGPVTITPSLGGTAFTDTTSITLAVGAATQLLVTKPDGTPLTEQLRNIPFDVRVTLADAFGNPVVNTAEVTVTLTGQTAGAGSGGAVEGDLRFAFQPESPVTVVLPAGESVADVPGVVYTGLSGTGATDDVTISAAAAAAASNASGLSGVSVGFSVRDIKLTVVADPTSITADGTSTSTIKVKLTDAAGAAQVGQEISVSTDLGTLLDGSTEVGGTGTFLTDGSGEVVLSLRSTTTVGTATVTALCPGACPATATVTFTAGPLASFEITDTDGDDIGDQQAGTAFDVRIRALDANSNVVTSFTGTVSLTSTGALSGTPLTTGVFTAGVLASQPVTITNTGASFTLSVTDGAVTSDSNAFAVTARSVNSGSIVIVPIGEQLYTGSPITPDVTVTDGGTPLVAGTDYTVAYSLNTDAGTATVTITGVGEYSGTRSADFLITPAGSSVMVDGGTTATFTYTGSAQGPVVDDFTATGSGGAVTLSFSGTGSTTYGPIATAPTDAGSYQVIATVAADANHTTASSAAFAFDITPRALTITVADAVKVAGESDPTFDLTYDGFVLGEDESVLSAVSVTRAAGETPGTYTLTPGGTSTNYAITPVFGELLIVGLTIGVQESGGVLTDREVTCVCEFLEPDSAVTLTIFSTPTVIATTTVAADGTCPGFGGIIPDSVPDGPHTLRIDGTAGDAAATPVSLSRAVNLTSGDGPVIGSGGVGSTSTPPPTPPAPPGSGGSSSPLTPPPSPSPLVPPEDRTRTPAPSNAPTTPAPAPANPPATPAPPREQPQAAGPPTADAPRGTVLGGAPADTVDLGTRGSAGAPAIPPDATLREVLEVTRTSAARTLEDLAGESLSGFASGVGLRIEVIGARTTARFVLSATERIDSLVLSEALRRSAPTQATDFASISAVAPVDVPAPVRAWSAEERTQADDVFAASRLPAPVLLSDLMVPADATWIRIEMQGATYLPGSLVHLTVTSDPVVLASAAVRRDGTVTIVGDLPVQILPAGEHRIRLVGTRLLGGIATDDAGAIVLPEDVLAEIARFDLGTDATVRVVGDNGSGGVHTALRVVPLDPVPPWWTLWIVLVAWLAATVLRRRGRLDGMRRRIVAHAAVVLSGVPAVVLGWIATTTIVAWWGAGLALLATLLLAAIVPRESEGGGEGRDAGSEALSAGA